MCRTSLKWCPTPSNAKIPGQQWWAREFVPSIYASATFDRGRGWTCPGCSTEFATLAEYCTHAKMGSEREFRQIGLDGRLKPPAALPMRHQSQPRRYGHPVRAQRLTLALNQELNKAKRRRQHQNGVRRSSQFQGCTRRPAQLLFWYFIIFCIFLFFWKINGIKLPLQSLQLYLKVPPPQPAAILNS